MDSVRLEGALNYYNNSLKVNMDRMMTSMLMAIMGVVYYYPPFVSMVGVWFLG